MLAYALTLALVLTGALTNGFGCNLEQCSNIMKEVPKPNLPITGDDDLNIFCPILGRIVQCFDNVSLECTGLSLREQTANEDENIAKGAELLLNLADLGNDLCSPDSRLHKDYLTHASCFHKHLPTKLIECEKAVQSGYDIFVEEPEDYEVDEVNEENSVHEEDEERSTECRVAAFTLFCTSVEISVECGEGARQTFQEIIKRSSLLRNTVCSLTDLEEAKYAFIEHLSASEEHIALLADNFDYRKKK